MATRPKSRPPLLPQRPARRCRRPGAGYPHSRGIEKGLHYRRDVTFHEDHNRTRVGHSAQNLAIRRRDTSVKGSIATKRLRAALNNDYLARLLEPI